MNAITSIYHRQGVGRAAGIMLLLLLILCLPTSKAHAQSACSDSLIVARNVYSRGLFDRTITALDDCWRNGGDLDTAQHREALRILAVSHLYLDNTDRMNRMMRHLMRTVDPGYRPDPLQDPLVIQDLAEKYRIKWYEKRWVQIGAAAVVGGTAAFLIFNEGPQQLGGPPELPDPPTK